MPALPIVQSMHWYDRQVKQLVVRERVGLVTLGHSCPRSMLVEFPALADDVSVERYVLVTQQSESVLGE